MYVLNVKCKHCNTINVLTFSGFAISVSNLSPPIREIGLAAGVAGAGAAAAAGVCIGYKVHNS